MNIISTTRSKQASFAAGAIGSCFKYLPQNGVVEAPMHYGSGNTSSQMQLVSSTASLVNLNGGSPARPKVLGVTAPSNMAKTVLGDTGEDDGGSLPCTPELQSYSEVDVSVCPAGDEALENDTRQLLDTFFRGFTGLSHPRWTRDKALSTMKRVVEDVLDKHRYAYNGMINKLGLDDRGDDMSVVSSVAESLFSDGTTNWGRIASLVAFGAVVCQHLKERGMDHCVQLVGQEISSYLLTDQRDWLVKANSWNGFVDFFQVADPESSVRNTLMAFAGFAGIGATLALLIRKVRPVVFAGLPRRLVRSALQNMGGPMTEGGMGRQYSHPSHVPLLRFVTFNIWGKVRRKTKRSAGGFLAKNPQLIIDRKRTNAKPEQSAAGDVNPLQRNGSNSTSRESLTSVLPANPPKQLT